MVLAPGARLGAYEIVGLIGAGGMGEVYKAHDTRLHRTVAIKVLGPQFGADPQFRARFDREAKTLSQIDHPHVCAIHDVGEHDGVAFLVMPYLRGETLAERLARGRLPVDEALKIAINVAEALDHAHTAGIIHRDLKPGNILLTKAGAMLLDFGLATPTTFLPLSEMSAPPTAAPLTLPGTLVGTLFYMAPEQLEARDVDARTDVFAFGAVLYEMLTGKRAFDGITPASVIASILTSDPPPLSSLRPVLPPALDRLVRKCLARDPADRWQTTRDLRDELRWIRDTPMTSTSVAKRAATPWLSFAALGLAVLLLAIAGASLAFSRPPRLQMIRFSVMPPGSEDINTFALSPDGRQLALTTSPASRLYVRPLDGMAPAALPDTDGARAPFWSPDGRALGFFASGKLKIVELADNTVRTVCDAPGARTSGDWNRDGTIIFGSDHGAPIRKVSARGGEPMAITTIVDSNGHIHPTFLPDGQHFLYYEQETGLRRGSIDSVEDNALVIKSATSTTARWIESGYLVFARAAEVIVQPFEPGAGTLSGEPLVIAGSVRTDETQTAVSVGASGVMAIMTRPRVPTELAWVARNGQRLATIADDAEYRSVQLSPDGSRLVANEQQGRDIWVFDLARAGVKMRVTSAPSLPPVWSPDGQYIVYEHPPGTNRGVYRRLASGEGAEEEILATANVSPNSYSPDGRYILATFFNSDTNRDLGVILLADRKPSLIVQTRFNETQGQFSPDGHSIAYVSDESGTSEVYVQRFPAAGTSRVRVSTAGGRQPRWRRDGRELFYLSPTGELMAASIDAGSVLKVGSPTLLFRTTADVNAGLGTTANYDVALEGDRFVLASRADHNQGQAVDVIVNWSALIDK